MIKILLKHVVMEVCLGKLFDNILMNFPSLSFDIDDVKLHSFVDVSILVYGKNIILVGCEIIKIDDSIVHLEYTGFGSTIILIAQYGRLIDIKGNYRTIVDNFLDEVS